MDRLLLVDGMNLLFQMFYGMPARITDKNGFPIQGILGFVGALNKIIRLTSPKHIVVIFDGETHNPRTDTAPEYKANRPDYSSVPETETPFCQLKGIFNALDVMGISYCETEGCEADDVIAGYTKAYPDKEIIISSFDSDFFQLICENVSVLRYRGDKPQLLTPNDIVARLGIPPELYACHKALTGDSSDNIKGVPKIGPKTAAQLLTQFGSLETMLADTSKISRQRIREAVENSKEIILKNYGLILLEGTKVLPFELGALVYSDSGYSTRDILSKAGIMY